MAIKFGPAGNAESFFEQGNKSSLQAPEWIAKMGLDAYEYQCGRGVKISDDSAQKLGEEAARCGISLSIHAPYYICLLYTSICSIPSPSPLQGILDLPISSVRKTA